LFLLSDPPFLTSFAVKSQTNALREMQHMECQAGAGYPEKGALVRDAENVGERLFGDLEA
jgi:hypothetical protein